MYSVTPSFIRSDERHDRHKGWPAASERCHGEEVERAFSPLQKLVHLVRLHEEHDAGSQRELLAVQDHDPEPFGHDQLMVPFVTMHGGIPALSDDELVHRGLSGPVLAADERFHLRVVAAFLQKTNRGDRPNVGRVQAAGENPPPSLDFAPVARHASYATGSSTPTLANASRRSRQETHVPQWMSRSQ